MTNHQPQTQPEKQKQNHPATFFNSSSVIPTTSQKRLRIVLHSQTDFKKHLQNMSNKISKIISFPRKLQNALLRSSLPTVIIQTASPHVVQKCSVKNVFLEISQNSQENTSAFL